MSARSIALVFGILYVGLGVLGMMPGAAPFPTNLALSVVHLAMGLWGFAAFSGWGGAQGYARAAAFVFAILGLAGMVHTLDRLAMPLYGPNVWLHLGSAAIAGFVGWMPQTGERRGLAGDRRRERDVPVAIDRRHAAYDRRKASSAA